VNGKDLLEAAQLDWTKARSSMNNGACVELARAGKMVGLRDSKNPDQAPFFGAASDMRTFLTQVKAGTYDRLP
jgi:Domain of unknown function (DUF397)